MGTIRPTRSPPAGDASGDLGGQYPNPIVTSLQGNPVSDADPQDGQILTWNGTAWVPGSTAASGTGGGGVIYYLNKENNPDSPTTGLTAPVNQELGLVASASQSFYTKNNIPTGGIYDEVIGFVTDLSIPNVNAIPAGIWDVNFWADSTSISPSDVSAKVLAYIYDGNSITLIGESGPTPIFDPTVNKRYTASLVVQETSVLITDRVYLILEVTAINPGKNITFYFGGQTPSFAVTTIPSIRGTGIVHVIDGTIQSPATAVDLNSADTSGILPISKGGTGLSTTPTNGQLLIGNGTGFTETTLTAGSGINISNGAGSITISNSAVLTVSGSAPVASSGGQSPTISLNDSGVVAGDYGSGSSVPSISITGKGLISSASSTPISVDASQISSGTLPISRGGTGLSTTPANGQLLIGNGTGFTETTLTQGTGISISNGSGSITVANTGVLSVAGSAPISSSGGATPTVSLNDSGVVAGSYGSASSIPALTVTAKGIVSSISSNSVSIDASQITSGTLPIVRGGTGLSSAGAAGNVLISDGTNLVSRTITGDVSLTSTGATTVVAVRNAPVSATPPVTNDILVYNGTSWVPSSIISTLQVSYQTVVATEAIAAGDVVYIVNSGGSGASPSVARAQANDISTIRGVIGFATTSIAKNAQGTVQTYGQLIGPVDTHLFSQGAPLFVSTTTPGGVTDIKPEAPNFAFQVGIVTRQGQPQNVTTGIVFISPIMQSDTNNLSNVIVNSAKVNDVLICTTIATPAQGGNPALPPVWTTGQLTKLYYTNTPLALSAGQQIISSNFDTAGSKVIYLPISSGNSTITLSSPKPIVDLTSSDYGRQLWLHNVGNANITIPRAGGGNRNVALEGGVSQTLLPGSIIKLMWINPGSGQAYWLQTEKIITST